ncbi:hypothetical protein GCM10009854_33450 [Saccharopolyspora halophila]|uniref:Uncharacterized protein n=1 Tax=Saccharopolyspora halophila TaxID=405551 RepID=A0ABN3GIZ6_9PSEU
MSKFSSVGQPFGRDANRISRPSLIYCSNHEYFFRPELTSGRADAGHAPGSDVETHHTAAARERARFSAPIRPRRA